MRILIAVILSAAFVLLSDTPATQLNNSTEGRKAKAEVVQAEAPRKEPTGDKDIHVTISEEKALTKQLDPVEPETAVKVETPAPQPLTDKEQLMQSAGIPQSDWAATDYIVSHESSWKTTATNAQSGAYGLCQALPASKMASAGDDYNSNPVTQLKWCHAYAHNRYGSWWSSFAFWQANLWW